MTARDVPRTPQPGEPRGVVASGVGPSEGLVRDLSRRRGEPEWLLRLRLRGVEGFRSGGLPAWATLLRDIGFGEVVEHETVDYAGSIRPPRAVPTGISDIKGRRGAFRVSR